MEVTRNIIKFIIGNLIPEVVKRSVFNYYVNKYYINLSFSQEGEDLVLNRFFGNKIDGFFIDVGAHHPFRFSNTFIFYKKGWRGINIDPLPGTMNLFDKYRSKDINLPFGISKSENDLTYYSFNDPALNTFSEAKANEYKNHQIYKIIKEIKCKVYPLKIILEKYLEEGTKIDFLTIDCEGFDLEVLQSNDWFKYRPLLVLVESHTSNLSEIKSCPIYNYMISVEYELYAKTHFTFFYKDIRC